MPVVASTGQITITDMFDMSVVNLSRESYIFAAGVTNALHGQSVIIEVTAMKGNSPANVAIGVITGLPEGLTTATSGSCTMKATITVNVTSAMNSPSGSLSIPVTVDEQLFTKSFAYGLALQGTTGASTPRIHLELPDGNTFTGNVGSPKNINVKLYSGEDDVTASAETQWYFNGVANANLNNLKTIQVYPSDVLGNLTIKVIAIYNNVAYQDSVVFLDLNDVYQVNISGKDKIKNSSENVVLTAIAFRGSTQITDGFRCRWTDIGAIPAIVLYEGINTTGTLAERGVVLTLTPSQINEKLDILCELSVDTVEQELELAEVNYVPNYDSKAYAAAMSVALSY